MRDSVKEEKGGGEPRTGEQIVRVRLVAEGSTRGKERHEIERFLGLAGTLSRWISSYPSLSLPPSICSFVVPIFAIFPINSPRTVSITVIILLGSCLFFSPLHPLSSRFLFLKRFHVSFLFRTALGTRVAVAPNECVCTEHGRIDLSSSFHREARCFAFLSSCFLLSLLSILSV